MSYKGLFVLFGLVAINLEHSAAFPRDVSVVKSEEIISQSEVTSVITPKEEQTTEEVTKKENPVVDDVTVWAPKGVPCQFEEPTEDQVCQELCLPKGYSYGLCVGGKCSCI